MSTLSFDLAFEVTDSAENPKKAVIWLHGLGANGFDFVPIVPHLTLNQAVRFIFPHAPELAVTINGGYQMPAWYDILAMLPQRQVNEQQFLASCAAIQSLIKNLNTQGFANSDIILMGFSQGGAIAYHTGLAIADLAGVASLSSYIALPEQLSIANVQQNVLIQHGSNDAVVPLSMAEAANSVLINAGFTPKMQTFTMAHEVCMAQIQEISQWLNQSFA